MEPQKETETNNIEETNSETGVSSEDKGAMSKLDHHMNKSVVSRIIVVMISLCLALVLGYVLYSQLLSQSGDETVHVIEEGVQESPEGIVDILSTDDIEARRALIQYINEHEEDDSGEVVEMTPEDRASILAEIQYMDDEEMGGGETIEMTPEDRASILAEIQYTDDEENDLSLIVE